MAAATAASCFASLKAPDKHFVLVDRCYSQQPAVSLLDSQSSSDPSLFTAWTCACSVT